MPILLSSSPGPNKSCCFQREPPEGCEKVRFWEETRYARYTSDRIFTAFFPLKCSEKCQLCQRRSLTRCIPTAHVKILLLQSISHLHLQVLTFNDTDLLGSLHTGGWWILFSCLLSANVLQSLCCLWSWWWCTHSLFYWMNQLLFFPRNQISNRFHWVLLRQLFTVVTTYPLPAVSTNSWLSSISFVSD